MSTVDKSIADRVIAGEFKEDRIRLIIEYDNAWGGKGYGLVREGQANCYTPSNFVRNPRVYWEKQT